MNAMITDAGWAPLHLGLYIERSGVLQALIEPDESAQAAGEDKTCTVTEFAE